MGWLIAAGIVVLLALLPLGVGAVYDEQGPVVRLIAGWIRIRLYPGRPDKENKKKPKEKAEKKKPASNEKSAKKKTGGGSWKDFLPLVQVGLDFLGDFRRKLRVNRLEMKLILAGDDPCDLAVNYGKAWAALGNLMPQLERLFVIRKRDVEVECDFTASKTLITARLDLTISLGRLLALVVRYGIRAWKEFKILKTKRKGGMKYEPNITKHA